MVAWWEKHQVALYVCVMLVALGAGWLFPMSGVKVAIEPALILLLFATFMGIPLTSLRLPDLRFMLAVGVGNFLIVPLLVWVLTRGITHQPALYVGVLLVLLAPCVDYVIVFSGLAGGAKEKLLALSPLLMGVQMVLLPAYLWLFQGPEVREALELEPFVRAFLIYIVLPLVAAAVIQALPSDRCERLTAAAMVPMMMLVLFVIVASQVAAVGELLTQLLWVGLIYTAFAVGAVGAAWTLSRLFACDPPSTIAVIFSVTTRNSLVVMPIALVLADTWPIVPLVVVSQTLVELIVMVILVRICPIIVRL